MRSDAVLFYTAMAMVFAGLLLRFAWPRDWAGVGIGYGMTLVGVVLFVVVIRRGRTPGE